MDETIEVLRIEIARLDVQPGETLLVRVPVDRMQNINMDAINQCAPPGVRVVVAPKSIDFSVIAASD